MTTFVETRALLAGCATAYAADYRYVSYSETGGGWVVHNGTLSKEEKERKPYVLSVSRREARAYVRLYAARAAALCDSKEDRSKLDHDLQRAIVRVPKEAAFLTKVLHGAVPGRELEDEALGIADARENEPLVTMAEVPVADEVNKCSCTVQ